MQLIFAIALVASFAQSNDPQASAHREPTAVLADKHGCTEKGQTGIDSYVGEIACPEFTISFDTCCVMIPEKNPQCNFKSRKEIEDLEGEEIATRIHMIRRRYRTVHGVKMCYSVIFFDDPENGQNYRKGPFEGSVDIWFPGSSGGFSSYTTSEWHLEKILAFMADYPCALDPRSCIEAKLQGTQ